jgi:condensin complex subunit 3
MQVNPFSLENGEHVGKDRRSLCQLLKKLHIPGNVDDDKLRTLKLLMHHLRSVRSFIDTETIVMTTYS